MQSPQGDPKTFSHGITAVLLLVVLGFGSYYYTGPRVDLIETTQELAEAKNRIETLESQLSASKGETQVVLEALYSEQEKVNLFNEQIEEITGVVGILQQLQGTDRELLQKYSRTYFLNENYVPSRLSTIQQKYLYGANVSGAIHADVKPHLENLLSAAELNGANLKIISAYRSSYEQSELNSRYQVLYGRGANQFSAEQGFSEHQLGTTIDFTTPELGSAFDNFGSTSEYAWLQQNAHKYGFVLSYPQENPYYIFEPWHWRFVGVGLASDLHTKGISFYDLSQEDINQYLLNIFES